MNNFKIPLLVVVGPTASGKTKLAVDLACEYNGEVVSADSMQIYKYLNIGTAKPSCDEMKGIRHHLIDFLEPSQSFSVADYVKLAKQAVSDIYSRGKLPIVCGGTGLYVSSLIDNIDFSEIKSDLNIRKELEELSMRFGNQYLLNMLREIDPELAANLHENNKGRIIRAIEVYKITGVAMSQHQKNSRLIPSNYNLCMLGLSAENRQVIYDRINLRVDIMLKNGLLKEAEFLLNTDCSNTVLQAIGYKELFEYLRGEKSFEASVEMLKQATRRYAKRQLTWFRRDERINWIMLDNFDSYENIFKYAKNIVAEKGIV